MSKGKYKATPPGAAPGGCLFLSAEIRRHLDGSRGVACAAARSLGEYVGDKLTMKGVYSLVARFDQHPRLILQERILYNLIGAGWQFPLVGQGSADWAT